MTYEFTEGASRQRRIKNSGRKTSVPMTVGRTFGNVDPDDPGELITTYRERKTKDNRVKSRNYAAGELVVTVDDLETDSIDLIFTVDRLFSTAQEGLVKGQLFDAQIFFDVLSRARISLHTRKLKTMLPRSAILRLMEKAIFSILKASPHLIISTR